jgi:hypothetical protein
MKDDHRVRTRRREQPLALIERRQPKGRCVRLEEAHRVRIECRDQGGAPIGAGSIDRATHNRLMAKVKSIEIA